jgi:hypothetical protein
MAYAVELHLNRQRTGQLIANFPSTAGMVLIPQTPLCFTTDHLLVETRLSLSASNLKVGQVLNQIKHYLQTPYQDAGIDLMNTRFKRSE